MKHSPEFEKWEHRVLILGASVLGVLIFIGFLFDLHLVITAGPQNSNASDSSGNSGVSLSQSPAEGGNSATSSCQNCVSENSNNETFNFNDGSQFTLELPSDVYQEANLVVISNPENLLGKISGGSPASGDWAQIFETDATGTATIIVKSGQPSISDFHVTVIVQ